MRARVRRQQALSALDGPIVTVCLQALASAGRPSPTPDSGAGSPVRASATQDTKDTDGDPELQHTIDLASVPETARLGITLRGLRRLRALLTEDFSAGRVQRPAGDAADWPPTVEGLRTEQVNTCWVEVVTKGDLKRLVQLEQYVDPSDVAPPQLFISHACECRCSGSGMAPLPHSAVLLLVCARCDCAHCPLDDVHHTVLHMWRPGAFLPKHIASMPPVSVVARNREESLLPSVGCRGGLPGGGQRGLHRVVSSGLDTQCRPVQACAAAAHAHEAPM